MPPFISKEHAAILARALNRRRFGLFTWARDMWRSLFSVKNRLL
jgi:hypothetical protein